VSGICHLVGVISDTHGLVRPEAVAALRGVELIIHAGDIGKPEVVSELGSIAPVKAIRGNNDTGRWAQGFPVTEVVDVGSIRMFVIHDIADLNLDPKAERFKVVISGHSHRPRGERKCGVLYLNPGSAGPRRFDMPVSVARLRVTHDSVEHELVTLQVSAAVKGRLPSA
jgi:hypothetical protein